MFIQAFCHTAANAFVSHSIDYLNIQFINLIFSYLKRNLSFFSLAGKLEVYGLILIAYVNCSTRLKLHQGLIMAL
jgi:hypothetical protein